MENRTQELIDEMLVKFSEHLSALSPSERDKAVIKLETQFSSAVSALKRDQTYIDLGKDVERVWGTSSEEYRI